MIPGRSRRESQAEFFEEHQTLEQAKAIFDGSEYPSAKMISAFAKQPREQRAVKTLSNHSAPIPDHPSAWMQRIEKTALKTCDLFFRTQYPEGYWWEELESNVTITSEYIMLLHLLGLVEPDVQQSMVKYLYNHQRANGAWGLYFGDEGDLSVTVETYFALKLAGEDPDSDALRKARDFILNKGGVESSRTFTKIWLALFSQYDWDKIPTMPVEVVLLPPHFYFNIYEFSSWARGTVVPLSIIMAIRPKFDLPKQQAIPELYRGDRPPLSWKNFDAWTHKAFFLLDRLIKKFEKRPVPSLRRRAIRTAVTWILEHQEASGDWGGIQPPMVYSVLALHYLGYPLDHPAIVKGLRALKDFCLEDKLGLRMQSCVSPVWDTALAALAMLESDTPPDHPALTKAADWIIRNQVKTGGDWQVKNCSPPGGWAFEFVNTQYPDVDDTAVILHCLQRMSPARLEGLEDAMRTGMDWCLSMQSTCGGWAAFDKDNDLMILNQIPFADHEAMVDYPTADVTGRVLEAMGKFGYDRSHPRARKAIEFLRTIQEPDGCWWGRWGVNYIYGTWSVLRGLITIGENPKSSYIQAALAWIKKHQNADGGWGETCESYERPELRGQGMSTPSQTAWALMALMVGGEEESLEARRGLDYLMKTQKADGSWEELHFTGTGFPKHFYIRYHNYRNCFPLMALGQYLQKLKQKDSPDKSVAPA